MDDSYVSSVSGAHRDSRIEIEGLEGTGGSVTVLGVDSMTDIVVGSVSGGPMGEGPGKDGAIDLIDLTTDAGRSGRNSVEGKMGLDTEDSGRGTFLAILDVETDGMLRSEGELMVEPSRG
jgi:hypothetical protein